MSFEPLSRGTRFEREIGEIVQGEAWGCMDITEPDAGSDMAALRAVGEDYAALARAFVVTQTSAALRVAEVTGRPRAVVTRHWVFVRGAPWAWGQSAGDVRQLVRSRRPGLTRTRLRDRPERVVLLADDAA